jgi:two-component system response regulator ResD
MAETSEALTVMIVDDDELIRKVVTIYFGNKGYRVISAMSGQDCLEKLRLSEPDAVLLDVTMPGLDGWEVCRRIRGFSAVPVIMLTARAQESDREIGVAVGADAYVTKPMSLKDLEAQVRAIVQRPSSAGNGDTPQS